MSFATELERFGDQTALITDAGESLSYRSLASLADSTFAEAGAPTTRSLIAIECANTAANVRAYLGALRAGFPALLIDAGLDSAMKERIYTHYGIVWSYSAEGHWMHRPLSTSPVHPDLALLLSTSGSTGSQKLVKLTLANLQANAASIGQYLALAASERPITVLPMHYSYGLSVLNSHLAAGATLLLTAEPIISRRFWEHFRRHGATSLSGVPTTYQLLRQMRFERMALPTLATLTQAGGRLAPEHVRWFSEQAQARGQRFFVMYGQTEATARIAYVPPRSLPEKAGAIGIAIPGGMLELVGDNGQEITTNNIIGELRYRGPNVMMGYAIDRVSLAEPDAQRGVLATGDLAWRDDDGYFHLAGRLMRFIKIFGNRIALDEVEAQLQTDGYDVAVTGEDDRLVVVTRGKANSGALTKLVAARYRLHVSAVRVVQVDDFPLTSSGKVRYAELLARIAL